MDDNETKKFLFLNIFEKRNRFIQIYITHFNSPPSPTPTPTRSIPLSSSLPLWSSLPPLSLLPAPNAHHHGQPHFATFFHPTPQPCLFPLNALPYSSKCSVPPELGTWRDPANRLTLTLNSLGLSKFTIFDSQTYN